MKSYASLIIGGIFAFLNPAYSQTLDTSAGTLQLAPMATGLTEPWGLAFLPDGSFLVTERDGRLMIFPAAGGSGALIQGAPDVYAEGQGGLLDVMIPRDFAQTRHVFLTYARPVDGGGVTALGRGTLSADGQTLADFTVLFSDPVPDPSGRHFGSRVVEAADGTLYLTSGERGAADLAQDPALANGKIFHLSRDGSPLTAIQGALPGVHSMGHRNPQGATLDANGQLWVTEHGAQGGDELNRVQAGANYGWPVISYGKDYDDSPIGVGNTAPGMEQPVHYWDPSIAPSGLMIYSGRMFPDWQGDVFTGSLKFDYLSRLDAADGYAEEQLASPETARVRDVREAPDGAIWFLSVGNGAVYRLSQ
jgi:aldose sugar dehydrogenase